MTNQSTTSTHEPFDETAKAFFHRLFQTWGISVEIEREVFSHSRKIDLVVTCTETKHAQLQNTVFAHFQKLNALELKGIHDPLTVSNYFRIMMRAWALGDQENERQKLAKKVQNLAKKAQQTNKKGDANELSTEKTDNTIEEPFILANQLTVTIICVTRPDKILDQLEQQYRFVKVKDGIYHCDEVLGKRIIHPSELELIPENYPLLLLAQGEKLKQFMALCLREELEEYYQLIIDIGLITDPSVILQKIWELNKMKYHIQEETWPAIDKFFQEMPEAFGKLPTLQQHALSVQQQALQQGELIGEQRALIHQLRCKFPQVSNGIVQHIEATFDIEQLNNWLEQILSADDLAEIDFKVPKTQEAGNH